MRKILVVMALPSESRGEIEKIIAEFDFLDLIYTGVGKVNAAIALGSLLFSYPTTYELVVNLGTAGSPVFKALDLLHCTRFVQHDMNAQAFGYQLFQTPNENQIILEPATFQTLLPKATLYTGDCFVQNADPSFEVVDMEGYALAKLCQMTNLPFLSVKFISDNANEKAVFSWEESLQIGSQKLADFLTQLAIEFNSPLS